MQGISAFIRFVLHNKFQFVRRMSSSSRSSQRDAFIQSIVPDVQVEDMDTTVLSECCMSLCTAVIKKLQDTDLQELTNSTPTPSAASFSTRSTVGIMFNGLVIDNMVVGGPAYNSGQLEPGDAILQIDHAPVTAEGLQQALIGSDVPGTTVRGIAPQHGAKQSEAAPLRSEQPLGWRMLSGWTVVARFHVPMLLSICVLRYCHREATLTVTIYM